MSSQFPSVEAAKQYGISMLNIEQPIEIVEDPELRVVGMEGFLLDRPTTSDETKAEIRANIDAQKGFKIKKDGDEIIGLVVAPFRDGFCCWIVS